MAKNPNKLNKDEIEGKEHGAVRAEPDLTTDQFGAEEQKKIIKMVMADVRIGIDSMAEWKDKKEKDQQHLNSEKPSVIENLDKRGWMSNRNLGLVAGIMDIYQATLLATCVNPDKLSFKATEKNDVDNRENTTRFTRWGLGPQEANFAPEADDFLNNRVGLGFSIFKIYWEVKYEWVDIKVPVYSKDDKKRMLRYDNKTEKRRFERGVIKNVDDLDNILLPSYGKALQDLPFMIERLPYYWSDLEDMKERKIIRNIPDRQWEKIKGALRGYIRDERLTKLRTENKKAVGIEDITDEELRAFPVDIYEWYGWYEKDGKREKYRFWVEPLSEIFLCGKPLRKIRRDNKYPYAGGPLRRIPGFIRGGSLTALIADPINALNMIFNQKSDFQFIENCPYGFERTQDGQAPAVRDLEPGKIFGHDGDPKQDIYFPNNSRSMAWADNDMRFLLEILERLTGAASYFLTSSAKGATATRDSIVEEKGDTKFGLWVKRIMQDISEAITMWIMLYQEWAPPKLGERVLGEDGKQLFPGGLTIETLRGGYDAHMEPDITSGSKSYDRQMKMWGLGLASQSLWFDPRMNPRGSHKLITDAMQSMGYKDTEDYMPPLPKAGVGESEEVKNEFLRFKQGDRIPEPPEGITQAAIEHYEGHRKQADEKMFEVPEEYRPHFEAHIFQTYMNMVQFIEKKRNEEMANKIAMNAMQGMRQYAQEMGGQPPGAPETPSGPGPSPGGNPAGMPTEPGATGQPPVGGPGPMGGPPVA